jgi:hypothetical protein
MERTVGGGTHHPREGRKAMSDSDDFSRLDDPEFLAERRRVREQLEHASEHEVSAELASRYQQLNDEFLRRASIAWARSSQGGHQRWA